MSRSSKTTQTTRREIPAWLEAGSQQAVGLATSIAGRPYEAYSGERVAGPAQNEQEAISMANRGTGAYESDLARSRELAERGSQAFTDVNMQDYMNPYVEQALDPALREIREQGARDQNTVGQAAGRVGAFGGSRQAILEAETRRGTIEEIGDTSAEGYASAFESGRNQFNLDRNAAARGAEQFRAVGAQGQQQLTQDIQNLLTTGGLDRTLKQAGLDFDYQQFTEARDWDITNLEPLLATLSTVPHGETQTSTNRSKKSVFDTVLGVGATIAGAYFTGGASLLGKGAGFFKKVGTGLAEQFGGGSGGEGGVGPSQPSASNAYGYSTPYVPESFSNASLGLPTYAQNTNFGNTYSSAYGG